MQMLLIKYLRIEVKTMMKKLNEYFGLGDGFTKEKVWFYGFIIYCLAILLINTVTTLVL